VPSRSAIGIGRLTISSRQSGSSHPSDSECGKLPDQPMKHDRQHSPRHSYLLLSLELTPFYLTRSPLCPRPGLFSRTLLSRLRV